MESLVRALCSLYGFLQGDKARYSRVSEENLAHNSLRELLWIAYKTFNHPIERAERGSGIEEYFAGQNPRFGLSDSFEETTSVMVTAGGDLLSSRDANPDNVSRLWDEAEDFLFSGDIRCANLETPIVPSRPAGFLPERMITTKLALNNTPRMFDVFHRGGRGINLFSTANNHCLDMGEDGLLESLCFLDSRGCMHVGTAAAKEERESFPVVEVNGIRIAFLSYTYATNGKKIPPGKEYLANYVRLNGPDTDISMIARHVRRARTERNADIVVACLHWSVEHESYPIGNVIEMGHRIMRLGVDAILGNHTHTIQPIEKYTYADPFTGRERSGVIADGLGDLVSCTEKADRFVPNSRMNCLVRLRLSKGTLSGIPAALISDLRIRPMYVHAGRENGRCTDYRLVDLSGLARELSSGSNKLGLSDGQKAEALRLHALARRILPSLAESP